MSVKEGDGMQHWGFLIRDTKGSLFLPKAFEDLGGGSQLTQRSRISALGLEVSCFLMGPTSHREMKSVAWRRESESRSSSSHEVF